MGTIEYRNKVITGGTGLVGSSFNSGYKLSSKDVDLLDENATQQYFKKKFYDVLIHCASVVGGLPYNLDNPNKMYAMNSEIFKNAFKYIPRNLFVNFSSTCVFPNDLAENGVVMTESDIFTGAPHTSNMMYAFAKRESTAIINQNWITDRLNGCRKLKAFTVIPCNVYGLNDTFNVEKGHVVPALIHKFHEAMNGNNEVTIWGDGTPLRQFIFSQDLANIVDKLIIKNKKYPSVIVAPDEEYTIKQIVDMIADIFNFKGKVIYDKSKPNGQMRKTVSNKLMKRIIGDYEFTPMYEGLKLTIENYMENVK